MHHHAGGGGGRPITTDFMNFFWKQRWNRAWRSDWGSCQGDKKMKKRIACKEAADGSRDSSGWICLRDLYSLYFLIGPWARLLVAKGIHVLRFLFVPASNKTELKGDAAATDPTIETSTLRCQLHLRPWVVGMRSPNGMSIFWSVPFALRILVDKCLMLHVWCAMLQPIWICLTKNH